MSREGEWAPNRWSCATSAFWARSVEQRDSAQRGRGGHGTAHLLRQHGSSIHGMGTGQVETSFDKGIHKFTWLMITIMMVMVPAGVSDQRPEQARLERSILLLPGRGVGLTPEMAADDRLGVSLKGRDRDVAEEGDGSA